MALKPTYYGIDGKEISGPNLGAYAYSVRAGNRFTFYIKVEGEEPFDPHASRITDSDKFEKVSEATFHFYVEFLKTRQRLWLTKASKSMMQR